MMNKNYQHELFVKYVHGPWPDKGFQWYEAAFPSPVALQAYLGSDPPVNRDIFGYALLSAEQEDAFHGVALHKALHYLTGGYTQGLHRLIALKHEFDKTLPPPAPQIIYKKAPTGTRFHIPNALAGSPNYMIRPVRPQGKRELTIHFNASFSMSAGDAQIFHRGLLTLSLIDLLERHNFRVNLRVFEMSYTKREIMLIRVTLKRHGGQVDKAVCHFIMSSKEFLRRIVFAVQETMPVVEGGWKRGYGKLFPLPKMRELLDIPQGDILIGSPKDMGISGRDLDKDAAAFFDSIRLAEFIKVY